MALTGTLSFTPVVTQTSQLDLVTGSGVTPTGAVGTAFSPMVITNGVGANQATNYASDTRTLAAGASETLDLSGGLVDSFGNILLFTRLIFLMIKCPITNTGDVRIDTALGTFTAIGTMFMNVAPGGCVVFAIRSVAALPIVAGASDLLIIRNGSAINANTYDIIAVGS